MAGIVPIGGAGIDAISFYKNLLPQIQGAQGAGGADAASAAGGAGQATPAAGFKDLIADKLQSAIELQNQGDAAGLSLATGTASDISAATIAVQKAAISLQTVAAFRNKAIEAYQDIMRMQV